jgi:hypothetical protein
MRYALQAFVMIACLSACTKRGGDEPVASTTIAVGNYQLSHKIYSSGDDVGSEVTSDLYITASSKTAVSFRLEAIGNFSSFCEVSGEALLDSSSRERAYTYRGKECEISFSPTNDGVNLQASYELHPESCAPVDDSAELYCGMNSSITSGTYVSAGKP